MAGACFLFTQKTIIMNAEKILQSNLLDILFENRNKQYGAYQLRKQYNVQLYKSLGFIFTLTISVLFFSTIKTGIIKSLPFIDVEPPEKVRIIEIPKAPVVPKAPAPRPATSNAVTVPFTNNVIISKDSMSNIPLPLNLDTVAIATSSHPGNGKKIVGVEPGPGEIKIAGAQVKSVDKESPLLFAEVMPEFPGGKNALLKFLEKNLKSPADIDAGDFVSVKIRFIVGYDGVLKGFELVEDGGKLFSNEVIRVLKKMPQWIPGKSRGENVSVYYTIPVKFIATE